MNKLKELIKITCVMLGALLLESCCNKDSDSFKSRNRHRSENIGGAIQIQIAKLRNHFLGYEGIDVSTLIAETSTLSIELKRAGRYEEAKKFDSYIDVLMFGNNTIDESINDVIELVGNRASSDLL
ncbi:hypothetical protein FACS189472_03290 [Alphaproteobacteria bacterium]|nr:hypothetical protein FACS189472_03290 [Alphaproteobacteria bacterium]